MNDLANDANLRLVKTPSRIALVGFGRIARTEHRPTIEANDAFDLVAVVDPVSTTPDMPCFRDLESLLDAGLGLDAVALCQPPQARYKAARLALRAGLDVLLEKPPGATVAEVESLLELARSSGRTLFAAWHSRFAPALPQAKAWLTGRRVRSVSISWREDVRDWHPGQKWVWSPGGFGVFNPGINAISVVTALLGTALHVVDGTLHVPANHAMPIAAEMLLETPDGIGVTAQFDWRKPGRPEWEIHIVTDQGDLKVTEGGARLTCGGTELMVAPSREYAEVYARFASLIATGECDVDLGPLRTAADAFLRCHVQRVESFDEGAVSRSP
jgi:D-galactose 1-dehydrogenase